MLTELDNCILGIIWRSGPMSAYDVRAHLGTSTTAAWSSSTGTVYPSIKRLLAAGLLQGADPSGPRNRQLLALTSGGLAALCRWLEDVRPELASSTADPLRTRVQFLAVLDHSRRRAAFNAYRQATRAQARLLEEESRLPALGFAERAEMLGLRGALAELRARLAWLDEIEGDIEVLTREEAAG